MNKHEMRKAYVLRFSSFLIEKLAENNLLKELEKIILFGSVAKGEAEKESDIDIFAEIRKKTQKIELLIRNSVDEFYKSRDAATFKIKGIDNKINLIMGKLDEWKDLHRSIMSTGIILWGKYEEKQKPKDTEHKVIIYWDKVKRNRGAFINSLYGFNIKNKHYKGLLEKTEGKRIGKSCIVVPIRHRDDVLELIKKYKINAKIIEAFIG